MKSLPLVTLLAPGGVRSRDGRRGASACRPNPGPQREETSMTHEEPSAIQFEDLPRGGEELSGEEAAGAIGGCPSRTGGGSWFEALAQALGQQAGDKAE